MLRTEPRTLILVQFCTNIARFRGKDRGFGLHPSVPADRIFGSLPHTKPRTLKRAFSTLLGRGLLLPNEKRVAARRASVAEQPEWLAGKAVLVCVTDPAARV